MKSLISALAITTLSVAFASPSWALTIENFSEQRFHALQAENKPVLIDVSAPWCPTCKRQKEILMDYQKNNPNSGITVLNVDFDNQKKWVTHFRAPRQSTFALYQGKKQVWFSVAETRAKIINQQLDSVKQETTTP